MSALVGRRAVLLGAVATFVGAAACSRPGGIPGVLRIGFLANLTHLPALTAIASGRLEGALGGIRVESRVFRAGPRVVEALLGGAIDMGLSGPAPIVIAHARHGAGKLAVVSGCASGGASFVVARGAGVEQAAHLRGKTVASVQLGSTQDVALRKYLRENGLAPTEHGGTVTVLAQSAPELLQRLERGDVAGAWLPEPWATRAVRELGAARLVDERDRWPGHAFPASLLVARRDFLATRPELAGSVCRAIVTEIDRALTTPAASETEAFSELRRRVGNPGSPDVFHEALRWVDFTPDAMPAAVSAFAADACALGLIPSVACDTLFARAA
jgi:NitT/TauT family transport system substrate-binding protein